MTGKGDLEEMPAVPPPLTCEQVDQEDLDTRYLRGELQSAHAEAFEAHYFGCDRCWKLVQQGNQVRAAGSRPVPRSNRILWIAAAAAFAAVIGAGLWRELQRPGPAGEPIDSLRSGRGEFAAPIVGAGTDRVTLTWQAVPEAASYRVRVFGGDGALLLQREVVDTSLAIAKDSVPTVPQLVWQVHALSPLGSEIARFPLTTTRP
jgi:hypothetical protein